jgi:hypothetical protein
MWFLPFDPWKICSRNQEMSEKKQSQLRWSNEFAHDCDLEMFWNSWAPTSTGKSTQSVEGSRYVSLPYHSIQKAVKIQRAYAIMVHTRVISIVYDYTADTAIQLTWWRSGWSWMRLIWSSSCKFWGTESLFGHLESFTWTSTGSSINDDGISGESKELESLSPECDVRSGLAFEWCWKLVNVESKSETRLHLIHPLVIFTAEIILTIMLSGDSSNLNARPVQIRDWVVIRACNISRGRRQFSQSIQSRRFTWTWSSPPLDELF